MAKVVKMPAGEFKARCLAAMERVRKTSEEVIITKHGKPVAKLVPVVEEDAPPLFGRCRGLTTYVGDVMSPIDVGWKANRD